MTINLELPNSIKCYDGAFDSETQRVLDAQTKAMKKIQDIEPEAICTYFPVEGEYVVHTWGRHISGYCKTRGSAISDALINLGIKE